MATIDSDAHVIECEETWSFLRRDEQEMAPVLIDVPDLPGPDQKFWIIDGRLIAQRPISKTDAAKAVRELSDVEGRLRQMDEIGTDIQVLYPTIFLRPVTMRPDVERALCHSYNRWLAGRVAKSGGRLSWAVLPPTLSIDSALEEIRFGHENGASAVFWKGFDNGRLPTDPYFTPLFAEIDRLGMALGLHAGSGTFALHDTFPSDVGFFRFKVPGLVAFAAILASDLPELYPNIRFGFIELQAQWVPYILKDFVRRRSHAGVELDPSSLMEEKRMFVACQTDDDLDHVIKYTGPNNLIAGTDFGHADTSSELHALQRLREAQAIEPQLIENILDANARELYGLTAP